MSQEISLMAKSSPALKRKRDGSFSVNKLDAIKVKSLIKLKSNQVILKKYGKDDGILKQCYFSEDGNEEMAERINFVYCSKCGTVLTSNNQGGGHIT